MQIIIDISDTAYRGIISADHAGGDWSDDLLGILCRGVANGTPLSKGHGRLKDEDEIVKAIIDRVEFLRKNDATFMRLRKDIDILGCIVQIRCGTPTILEADTGSEG